MADTYTDYPQAARNNAKKVLKWKEEHGDEVKAMTPTGWRRASQLASGAALSYETVKRIAAFERHRENSKIDPKYKSTPWKDNGYVAWLGWGGASAIAWAKRIVASKEKKSKKEAMVRSIVRNIIREEIINESEIVRLSKLDFIDLEDDIIDKIPKGRLYHGSNDVSWFNGMNDINVESNTKNAKSKYFFLSPRVTTALNYSIDSKGMTNIIQPKSGIIAFSVKGKYKKLNSSDFRGVSSIEDVEMIYDNYKKMGYDYLINSNDGDNHVILNNSSLKYLGRFYNIDSL